MDNSGSTGSVSSSSDHVFLGVLDFEATCDRDKSIHPQEIIEFPFFLINASTGEIVAEFHSYCKPLVHPKLTDFCTKLTGITQNQVNKAPPFRQVLLNFEEWLKEQSLDHDDFASVACGDWDLGTILPECCAREKIPIPVCFQNWINLKQIFRESYNMKKNPDFKQMMDYLVLPIEGRHHSGRDDAKNMTSIIFQMVKDGFLDNFEITS